MRLLPLLLLFSLQAFSQSVPVNPTQPGWLFHGLFAKNFLVTPTYANQAALPSLPVSYPSNIGTLFTRGAIAYTIAENKHWKWNGSGWTELAGTSFTTADARAAISLTTTGTSGAATYNSSTGVLNVPFVNRAFGGSFAVQYNNADTSTGSDRIQVGIGIGGVYGTTGTAIRLKRSDNANFAEFGIGLNQQPYITSTVATALQVPNGANIGTNNIFIAGGGSANFTEASDYIIGKTTNTHHRIRIGNSAGTGSGVQDFANVIIGRSTAATTNSTSAIAAQLSINRITSQGADTTVAILVNEAPTGGNTNLSLYIRAGGAVINGPLTLNTISGGLLPPRLTTAQRDAIASPATGLTLFCTNCTATDGSTGVMQTYNGSTWKNYW